MKHNKDIGKETKKDFFETKIDQTPYLSFWVVAAGALAIAIVVISILWSLAGTIKREVRLHLPNLYNFSFNMPKIALPKIPDKIATPDLNKIVDDQVNKAQENIKNNVQTEVNDQIQTQTDKLKL